MKKFASLILTALLGTVPAYAGDASVIGAFTGAAVGGIAGSGLARGPARLVTTAAGVGLGATAGDLIGQGIDHPARFASTDTRPGLYSETPSLQFTSAAPNYVAPPAPPPIYIDQGAQTYCRPYSQMVNVHGRAREEYGTTCLQPDGNWRPVP